MHTMRLLSRTGFLEHCVNGGKHGSPSRLLPQICKYPAFHSLLLENPHPTKVLRAQWIDLETHISIPNYGGYYFSFLIKTLC
jgi:hypothetical protein